MTRLRRWLMFCPSGFIEYSAPEGFTLLTWRCEGGRE